MQSVLNREKPTLQSRDEDCGSRAYLLSFSQGLLKERIGVVDFIPQFIPNNLPCGTCKIERRYRVDDNCSQYSEANQTFYVSPEAPVFTYLPESSAEKKYSTSVESLTPESQGDNWPEAKTPCSENKGAYAVQPEARVEFPVPILDQCGSWVITRTWRAFFDFGEALALQCEEEGLDSPPEAKATQQFDMQDDEASRFIEMPLQDLYITFFDNYDKGSPNAPLILDIVTNEQTHYFGLQAGGVTLTSADSDFVWSSTDFTEQATATCRESGIAQFTCTWTASNKVWQLSHLHAADYLSASSTRRSYTYRSFQEPCP